MGFAQDLSTVIECARGMQEQKNTVFVLVGDGINAQKWRKLARDLPNVRFVKWLAPDGYNEALRAADVCLVPLSTALKVPAIPGKIPTIMAVGRPLVAVVPHWSDTIPLIQESKCGIIVRPDHPEELQAALEELHANPSLRDELGNNAMRYAREHFALPAAISSFENVLSLAVEAS